MIDVAIDAAQQGGQLAVSYFKNTPKVLYKADNTPVTIADKKTEKLIRKIISKKFPDHGIIGEELENVNPKAQYQWVLDPIDGTSDFVRKLPYWSTFVALLYQNQPIIGVVYSPVCEELYCAQKGKGLYLNGKKIKLSKISHLSQASLTHGSVNRFGQKGKLQGLATVAQKVQTRISLGSHNLNLLLKGDSDIQLEAAGSIWDFAAPSILVEEGGGRFSDFDGKKSLTSGTCMLTNGILHDEVLKLLNS